MILDFLLGCNSVFGDTEHLTTISLQSNSLCQNKGIPYSKNKVGPDILIYCLGLKWPTV